jgi:hypothetical protein
MRRETVLHGHGHGCRNPTWTPVTSAIDFGVARNHLELDQGVNRLTQKQFLRLGVLVTMLRSHQKIFFNCQLK